MNTFIAANNSSNFCRTNAHTHTHTHSHAHTAQHLRESVPKTNKQPQKQTNKQEKKKITQHAAAMRYCSRTQARLSAIATGGVRAHSPHPPLVALASGPGCLQGKGIKGVGVAGMTRK